MSSGALQVFELIKRAGLSLDQALHYTDAVVSEIDTRKSAGILSDAAKAISGAAAPITYLAIAAPPTVGYLGGRALAKSFDAGSGDVADIQKQELIAELQANADAVRQRMELRENDKKRGAAI